MGKGHFTIKLDLIPRKLFVETKVARHIVINKIYTVKNVVWNKKPYFALGKKEQRNKDTTAFEKIKKLL